MAPSKDLLGGASCFPICKAPPSADTSHPLCFDQVLYAIRTISARPCANFTYELQAPAGGRRASPAGGSLRSPSSGRPGGPDRASYDRGIWPPQEQHMQGCRVMDKPSSELGQPPPDEPAVPSPEPA